MSVGWRPLSFLFSVNDYLAHRVLWRHQAPAEIVLRPSQKLCCTRELIVVNGIELACQAAALLRYVFLQSIAELETRKKHNATGCMDATPQRTSNDEDQPRKFNNIPTDRRLFSQFVADIKYLNHPFAIQCLPRPLFSSFNPYLSRRTLSRHHGHHSTPAEIVLRPYQEHCLEKCTKALAGGWTRIGVSLPTGAGKTTVFISLLARIMPPSTNEEATRALIVVNSIELARQTAAQINRMFPHWEVELEQGQKHNATGLADVTIATYQTLKNEQRLMKFDSKMMKAVIVDEAHHAAAPSYRRLLSQFHADIEPPRGSKMPEPPPHKIPIIGFSATFSRHDEIALNSVFELVVYHRNLLEMIREEWLCEVRLTSVKTDLINLTKVAVNIRTKDFQASSLARAMNSGVLNHLVVRSWLDRAAERKSTLVFGADVQHVKDLTQTFRGYGIDARYLTGATAKGERQQLVESFKNGEFPVLVNCAILTEGADIPNIDCVVLARPTRSQNLFTQMIGRGLRLSPATGKTDCRIIDFVNAQDQIRETVISVPKLFGLDPGVLDIDDETIDSLKERIAKSQIELADEDKCDESLAPISDANYSVPIPLQLTYNDDDDPFITPEHMWQPITEEVFVRRTLSRFSWVDCGKGLWVLSLHERGSILVEQIKNNDAAKLATPEPLYKARFKSARHRPSHLILSDEQLWDAIRACDDFVVKEVFKDSVKTLDQLDENASWREQPATPAQLAAIRKLEPSPAKLGVDLEELSKGQAANILTRIMSRLFKDG